MRKFPKPGELLALRIDRARPLFDKWLRDDSIAQRIAVLSFAQHAAMAQQSGWLQARWHEDGDLTVAQFLAYNSVWEVNPFEVGARRPMTRKEFAALRERILRLLDLRRLVRRPFIALSNGETRRVLLAHALLKNQHAELDKTYAEACRSRDVLYGKYDAERHKNSDLEKRLADLEKHCQSLSDTIAGLERNNQEQSAEISGLYNSRAWRVGSTVLRPFRIIHLLNDKNDPPESK